MASVAGVRDTVFLDERLNDSSRNNAKAAGLALRLLSLLDNQQSSREQNSFPRTKNYRTRKEKSDRMTVAETMQRPQALHCGYCHCWTTSSPAREQNSFQRTKNFRIRKKKSDRMTVAETMQRPQALHCGYCHCWTTSSPAREQNSFPCTKNHQITKEMSDRSHHPRTKFVQKRTKAHQSTMKLRATTDL